jgi:hypothetical protein
VGRLPNTLQSLVSVKLFAWQCFQYRKSQLF